MAQNLTHPSSTHSVKLVRERLEKTRERLESSEDALYREDYYDLDKAQRENKENVCEIIVANHRNGPTGVIEVFFDKEHARFQNLERRRQEAPA